MRLQKSSLAVPIASFLLGSLLSGFLPLFCRMSFWEQWGSGDVSSGGYGGGYECVRDTFYHSFNGESTAFTILLNIGILVLGGLIVLGLVRLIRSWRLR